MRLLVLLMAGVLSTQAAAHEAGNWIGRLSLDFQSFDVEAESSSGLLAANHVSMDNDYRVGYSLQYFLLDYLSLGVATSWPYRHKVKLSGGGTLGDVRFFPATVTLQYSLPKWYRLQPWVGVGYHYSMTRSERGSALGAESLKMDDMDGLALELGLDWDLRRHTTLGLRASRVSADPSLQIRDAAGVEIGSLKLDAEPTVWSLNLSRRW